MSRRLKTALGAILSVAVLIVVVSLAPSCSTASDSEKLPTNLSVDLQ